MKFKIRKIEKFSETVKGDRHYFNIHFTDVTEEEREEIAHLFEKLNFEPEPRITLSASYIQACHTKLKTANEVRDVMEKEGIDFLDKVT